MRTYRDNKTGKEIDINIYGNDWLGKITLGLWDKMGFAPKSAEDCKLVARIIKNHIKYQRKGFESIGFQCFRLKREHPKFIDFMEEVAIFFENAIEGLIDPNVEDYITEISRK